jgi:hypothetical protein
MLEPYSKEIEAQMQELYSRLPEKSRRLYAGVEALKFLYGGISYIAGLFGCSRDTVSVGGLKNLAKQKLCLKTVIGKQAEAGSLRLKRNLILMRFSWFY